MSRLALATALAAAVAGVWLLSTPDSAQAQPGGAHYEYCVRDRGVGEDHRQRFARAARQILADTRGWSLGGSIRFHHRSSCRGADFVLWLSAPRSVGDFSGACSTRWSCRVGRNVIINSRRWHHATRSWNRSGGSLQGYHRLVINHEVGHRLGLGHAGCPRAGARAPVMMQQSIDLGGCRHNPFPTGHEGRRVADRHGVAVLGRLGNGDLARAVDGRTVYLLQGGRRRPIPNRATLQARTDARYRVVARSNLDRFPAAPPVPDVEAPATADGMLLRARGHSGIHVMRNGLRRAITDPRSFREHGLFWSDVREIPPRRLEQIPSGYPLPSSEAPLSAEGTLVRAQGTAAVFVVDDGRRRLVPSTCAFDEQGLRWEDVRDVSRARVEDIPRGGDLPAC